MQKLPDSNDLTAVFLGIETGSTINTSKYVEHIWRKPEGAKLHIITIQAPGGRGANGSTAALSNAASGGGGGGPGGNLCAIVPSFALPDQMVAHIAVAGNIDGMPAALNYSVPTTAITSGTALIVPYVFSGRNATSSSAALGGSAASDDSGLRFLLTSASFNVGSNGTANAASNAVSGSFNSGGTGGTGVDASNSTASSTPGQITVANFLGNIPSPGTGGGVNGNHGHKYLMHPTVGTYNTGGTGGAGASGTNAVGGNGGDGGWGCGGGGGGGANGSGATGGTGGRGGPGYIIVQTLV
jgi:hypothetical protein